MTDRAPRGLRPALSNLCLAALVGIALAASAPATAATATADGPELDPSIPSPAQVLGYELGERFTPHHALVDYVERLAEASPRVALERYGTTYEGRPLMLLAISSEETIARLDEARREHLALADPRGLSDAARSELAARLPVVVQLSYGVHGNESSSAEAAMAAAHLLAAAEGERWDRLRAGAIVLVDPLANPDGRDRYVSGYQQLMGSRPDPWPGAVEHAEPWPGGRQNHYLIDLNRDWSWATQQETRHRIGVLRAWEPQVHVDYHEMFSQASYFFPPPADPVHPLLDGRTVRWLDTFGRANARAFEERGWPYFKSETFDLFYPGYGDSYPTFRGAVGMTYEMAGHGRAGLALTLADGSILTLADRIERHFTTSIATVETAVANRQELLADFAQVRAEAAAGPGSLFFWSADAPEARAMADLLALHGLEVGRLDQDTRVTARSVAAGSEDDDGRPRTFTAGTWVVDTAQPLGSLARTLLERSPELGQEFLDRQRERLERGTGTEFYDITAWSLPLAFNVPTWRVDSAPPVVRQRIARASLDDALPAELSTAEVGYLIPPHGLAGFRMMAALARQGIDHRVTTAELTLDRRTYPSGTVFVPRHGNAPEGGGDDGDGAGLATVLARLAADAGGIEVVAIDSAYTTRGVSLGSSRVPAVLPPTVGLIWGEGASPTSLGALWHLFDQGVDLPHHRIDAGRLERTDLDHFDVLVLPDGNWGRHLGEDAQEDLAEWVEDGGVLVAIGDAYEWLADAELTTFTTWQPPDASETLDDPSPLAGRPVAVPGGVVATEVSPEHPLAIGLPSPPPALVSGSRVILASGDPSRDVLTVAMDEPVLAGVVWPEAADRLAGSLLVGMEPRGRGAVVLFAQEPDFRLFWRGTAPLFLNAVFYGKSWTGGRGY